MNKKPTIADYFLRRERIILIAKQGKDKALKVTKNAEKGIMDVFKVFYKFYLYSLQLLKPNPLQKPLQEISKSMTSCMFLGINLQRNERNIVVLHVRDILNYSVSWAYLRSFSIQSHKISLSALFAQLQIPSVKSIYFSHFFSQHSEYVA